MQPIVFDTALYLKQSLLTVNYTVLSVMDFLITDCKIAFLLPNHLPFVLLCLS